MKYVVDAYAWMEYLDGSSSGEKVNDILIGKDEIFSLNLTVSEIISRTKRLNKDIELAYRAIISNSRIIDITPEISKEAGLFHAKMREKIKDFGLVDSFIFVVAKKLNAKILTGDEHFRGFKEAIFIK